MDLMAAIESDIVVAPGKHVLVPNGISIELPRGFEAQVRPRSGLAANHGVTVLNTPGTIDSDYRGELKTVLINLGDVPFTITRGMRIAQMIVARHERVDWTERSALSQTERGAGGYGSTGHHTVKQT
jgi:dUTP pyrophosphatase